MPAVRLIAAVGAAVLALGLAGCSNAEDEAAQALVDAYAACQTGVTPQFAIPAGVSWPVDAGEPEIDGSVYTFTVTVQSEDAAAVVSEYDVVCTVEQSGTAWMLDTYSITAVPAA
jgi:uncharacterized lipoprotein